MAVFSAVFSFNNELATTATLGATTASANITIGKDRKFAVTATGAFNLKMGMAAAMTSVPAAATDFEFPASQVFTISTNTSADTVSLFNPGGSSITYWLQPLCD